MERECGFLETERRDKEERERKTEEGQRSYGEILLGHAENCGPSLKKNYKSLEAGERRDQMCIFKDNYLLWKEFSGEKGREKRKKSGTIEVLQHLYLR